VEELGLVLVARLVQEVVGKVDHCSNMLAPEVELERGEVIVMPLGIVVVLDELLVETLEVLAPLSESHVGVRPEVLVLLYSAVFGFVLALLVDLTIDLRVPVSAERR